MRALVTIFLLIRNDILNSIAGIVEGSPVGKTISDFDLREMEGGLQKDVWVKTAQMFFDNNNKLTVNVLEREPLARVFTTGGTTFYVDSSLAMLPLSEKFSARLPVFTGFPSDKMVLAKQDSILLKDVLNISMAIQKDPFRMALIDQVDITPQRLFEMVPKIGNLLIVFGDAANVEEKFNKLQLFYQQVMVKAGWSKYSVVNVQYTGQIVAKRKGAEDKSSDSLRTLQLMQLIAENAERQSSDSLQMIAQDNENNTTNINLVQQSMERDDYHGPDVSEKIPKAFPVIATRPSAESLPRPNLLPAKKRVTIKVAGRPIKIRHAVIKHTILSAPTKTNKPKAVLPPATKPVKKTVSAKPNNEY